MAAGDVLEKNAKDDMRALEAWADAEEVLLNRLGRERDRA